MRASSRSRSFACATFTPATAVNHTDHQPTTSPTKEGISILLPEHAVSGDDTLHVEDARPDRGGYCVTGHLPFCSLARRIQPLTCGTVVFAAAHLQSARHRHVGRRRVRGHRACTIEQTVRVRVASPTHFLKQQRKQQRVQLFIPQTARSFGFGLTLVTSPTDAVGRREHPFVFVVHGSAEVRRLPRVAVPLELRTLAVSTKHTRSEPRATHPPELSHSLSRRHNRPSGSPLHSNKHSPRWEDAREAAVRRDEADDDVLLVRRPILEHALRHLRVEEQLLHQRLVTWQPHTTSLAAASSGNQTRHTGYKQRVVASCAVLVHRPDTVTQ